MPGSDSDSAAVSWVVSFLAFYKTRSLEQAGKRLDVDAKTIASHVRRLEQWLRYPLMDEADKTPTLSAREFLASAERVYTLMTQHGLSETLKNARVRADGVCVVRGKRVQREEAARIGNILHAARERIEGTVTYQPEPRIDPRTIDMGWWDAPTDINQNTALHLPDDPQERRIALFRLLHVILAAIDNDAEASS